MSYYSKNIRKKSKFRRFRRKFLNSYRIYLLIFTACVVIGFLLTVSPSGLAKFWDASKASLFKQMFHYQPMDKERQITELQKAMEILKKFGQ